MICISVVLHRYEGTLPTEPEKIPQRFVSTTACQSSTNQLTLVAGSDSKINKSDENASLHLSNKRTSSNNETIITKNPAKRVRRAVSVMVRRFSTKKNESVTTSTVKKGKISGYLPIHPNNGK